MRQRSHVSPTVVLIPQAYTSSNVLERLELAQLPVFRSMLLDCGSQAGDSAWQCFQFAVETIIVEKVQIADGSHLLVPLHDAHNSILYDSFEAFSHGLAELSQWLTLGASLASKDDTSEGFLFCKWCVCGWCTAAQNVCQAFLVTSRNVSSTSEE